MSILGFCRVLLGPFWDLFGTTLGSFWDHFGTILGPLWDNFGTLMRTILGPFWDPFLFLPFATKEGAEGPQKGPKGPLALRRS